VDQNLAITTKIVYRADLGCLHLRNGLLKLRNMGRPYKTHGKKKISMMVPMTVAMHARLKQRAKVEGRSMSAIIRELVDGYLGTAEPKLDVYDEVSRKVMAALES